jgi:hypothetical protein
MGFEPSIPAIKQPLTYVLNGKGTALETRMINAGEFKF